MYSQTESLKPLNDTICTSLQTNLVACLLSDQQTTAAPLCESIHMQNNQTDGSRVAKQYLVCRNNYVNLKNISCFPIQSLSLSAHKKRCVMYQSMTFTTYFTSLKHQMASKKELNFCQNNQKCQRGFQPQTHDKNSIPWQSQITIYVTRLNHIKKAQNTAQSTFNTVTQMTQCYCCRYETVLLKK